MKSLLLFTVFFALQLKAEPLYYPIEDCHVCQGEEENPKPTFEMLVGNLIEAMMKPPETFDKVKECVDELKQKLYACCFAAAARVSKDPKGDEISPDQKFCQDNIILSEKLLQNMNKFCENHRRRKE